MEIAESLLVAVIVASCAAFSTWRLLSVRARLRVLDALIAICGDGAGFGRLRSKTLEQLSGGGCGSCAASKGSNAVSPPVSRRPGVPRR